MITKKGYKKKKKYRERYQSLPKEEKEKKWYMVVKDTKISQKMKNKRWLSIEKNITKWEKSPYYNYKKLFSFKKFSLFLGVGLD